MAIKKLNSNNEIEIIEEQIDKGIYKIFNLNEKERLLIEKET